MWKQTMFLGGVVGFTILILIMGQQVSVDSYLISNTDQCLVDCSLKFAFRLNKDVQIQDSSKFTTSFRKADAKQAGLLQYELKRGYNESYNTIVLDHSDTILIGIDGNGTTVYDDVQIFKNVTEWHTVYKSWNPLGETLKAGEWYFVEITGKKKAVLGKNNVDAIPKIAGIELPYAWWNSTWKKRQSININVSAGTLTAFQTMVNVSYNQSMQTDFDDIRFTNNCSDDATTVYFWKETQINSGYVTYWIKPDTINGTVCMYYNNSVATAGDFPGEFVFEMFDNFTGTALNTTTKWTVAQQDSTYCNYAVAGYLNIRCYKIGASAWRAVRLETQNYAGTNITAEFQTINWSTTTATTARDMATFIGLAQPSSWTTNFYYNNTIMYHRNTNGAAFEMDAVTDKSGSATLLRMETNITRGDIVTSRWITNQYLNMTFNYTKDAVVITNVPLNNVNMNGTISARSGGSATTDVSADPTFINISWYRIRKAWILEPKVAFGTEESYIETSSNCTQYNITTADGFQVTNSSGTFTTDTEHGDLGRIAYGGPPVAWSRVIIPFATSAITTPQNATLYFRIDNGAIAEFGSGFNASAYYNKTYNNGIAYCTANATTKEECWIITNTGTFLGNASITANNATYAINITAALLDDYSDGTLFLWLKSNKENMTLTNDVATVTIDSPFSGGIYPTLQYCGNTTTTHCWGTCVAAPACSPLDMNLFLKDCHP